MKVGDKTYRTVDFENGTIFLIDQNALPFKFRIIRSNTYLETCHHIKTMTVRGAGAIGATAGFAMAQAALQAPQQSYLEFINEAKKQIAATRPTAQNLFYALEKTYNSALISPQEAVKTAVEIADNDANQCQKIGMFGQELISTGCNILTHCNAGWLAFVDYGSALSPIYLANRNNKQIHVWVDETRPRGQGARLTSWELMNENVPHTIIADNSSAFLMQQGKVNMVIVGADRIAANGDTANKIGTLEKAIAAKYYNIPFYVAAPSSTFDIECKNGEDINIEYRDPEEVLYTHGLSHNGNPARVLSSNPGAKALNPAFDVTPAELISGFITEKGIINPDRTSIGILKISQ